MFLVVSAFFAGLLVFIVGEDTVIILIHLFELATALLVLLTFLGG